MDNKGVLLLLFLLFAWPSYAQESIVEGVQTAAPKPLTQCAPEEYRAFDFWLGTWRVTSPDGQTEYGVNTIGQMPGGCALLEQWQAKGGAPGQSFNYYDPLIAKWRQFWRSPGGIITLSSTEFSLDKDHGLMKMEGFFYSEQGATSTSMRGEWRAQNDGTVSQQFWIKDKAGEWQVWFHGIYHPVDQQEKLENSTAQSIDQD